MMKTLLSFVFAAFLLGPAYAFACPGHAHAEGEHACACQAEGAEKPCCAKKAAAGESCGCEDGCEACACEACKAGTCEACKAGTCDACGCPNCAKAKAAKAEKKDCGCDHGKEA